jgi:peptidoglycan/LPS O-acetylase OafA/YrhL
MAGELIPIVAVVALTYLIITLSRIISDGFLRRQILQRGLSPEQASAFLARPSSRADRDGALKWGLVLAGIGAALVLIQFLPYSDQDPFTYGLLFLFAAGGLLVYVAVTRRHA